MDIPTLYGIPNCDTMKQAFQWLEGAHIAYNFHDYTKQTVETDVVMLAIEQYGWQEVINRKGTTWRKLPENVKITMDVDQALEIACQSPSIIKRPLLLYRQQVYLGFKDGLYQDIFKT